MAAHKRQPKPSVEAEAGPRLEVEYLAVKALTPYARNSRTHSDAQVAQIAASIREFGFTNPILIDDRGTIIAGHGRLMAAMRLGLAEVPTICLGHLTAEQRRAYVIADNRLALNAGWDMEMLAAEVRTIQNDIDGGLVEFGLDILGFDTPELAEMLDAMDGAGDGDAGDGGGTGAGSLAERFGVPPFSVLNAREGWWQDRKRAWLKIGIRSELGRGENGFNAAPGGSIMVSGYDENGNRLTGLKKPGTDSKAFGTQSNIAGEQTGTSIFDPVLCELAYRWFCPDHGAVFDPFAGGSVRGIVAARLGLRYTGIDLRGEQVAANDQQWTLLADFDNPPPRWIAGDSRDAPALLAGDEYRADMIFTCPPYADLEVYSDDPRDLSTMAYPDFVAAYREIIAKAGAVLRDDRFAAVVVGEVRDKAGCYRGFVPDTIAAFEAAGMAFYNEAILVTAVGSLPIRVGKQFTASRKLGKTHQNVLVFAKGDPRKACAALGTPEFGAVGGEDEGSGE